MSEPVHTIKPMWGGMFGVYSPAGEILAMRSNQEDAERLAKSLDEMRKHSYGAECDDERR